MANFGWKYGATVACPPAPDCPPCNPSASCSVDVSALWIEPVPITVVYDGYFVTPFVSGSETALIWTLDNAQTSSF